MKPVCNMHFVVYRTNSAGTGSNRRKRKSFHCIRVLPFIVSTGSLLYILLHWFPEHMK